MPQNWENIGDHMDGISCYATTQGSASTSSADIEVVPLDSIFSNTNEGVFALDSNAIEILVSGTYLINGDVTTEDVLNNNRTDSVGFLYRDSGSGFTVVTGTECYMYNRNTSQGTATGSINTVLNLNAGDKLQLRYSKNTGTMDMASKANACRLSIIKVK